MKHWIRKFISCILTIAIFMSAIEFPVGAYDFSMNEVIHQYNSHAFTRKNTPAVKWNGKTELKENSYYYTTSAVTISRDVTLPENSTLEIRKTLKITNGAKLTVLGDLLVDYDAKVNPVNGTLTVGKSGYISRLLRQIIGRPQYLTLPYRCHCRTVAPPARTADT